jgi:hypothetical protein
MKLGLIAPIQFLDKYCITKTQYCLPSLLVESSAYREFYSKRKARGDTVILDCRKDTWKRQPEEIFIVKNALEILNPDILVLPSYMYNLDKTLEIYEEWKSYFKQYPLCSVVEGTDLREIKDCIRKYKGMNYAYPAHLINIIKEASLPPSLLILDNRRCLEESYGLGSILVTSLPVRLGLQGRLLCDYLPSPPYLDYHREKEDFPMITKRNVEEAIIFYGT